MDNNENKNEEINIKAWRNKTLAWRMLVSVDYVDIKAADEGLTISPAWRAWRSQLRAVIRGERLDVPPEPARYTSTPSPPPEPDITEPPPEVLAEAQPDETLVELKARLLAEFASLRNMLVGHIPMTEAQLLRLQALENYKFQTWLQQA